MRWQEVDGIEWVETRLAGARAVFSTRSAGSIVEEPWPFAEALGISAERIVSSRQVHGSELAYYDAPVRHAHAADGHVLRKPGPIGLVYVADCIPVAVAGPKGAAILHCGWRGLAAGIVAKGVEAVDATHAAVGPGIGPCCFEVGDEVLGEFAELGEGLAAGRMLDLPEVTRRLLQRAGVRQIESEDICTRCEPELFFSHRRDGGPWRQAGLAWLDDEGA